MKKNISDILKGAKDFKDKATEMGKGAKKTAGGVKEAVSFGVEASKAAFGKASKMINKEKISQGLDVTSKGLENAAKGAKTLAKTMEKASYSVKSASDKIKNKP